MKKFNESIQISVSIDTIASMLLDQMKDDFKHRELVAETIVGRMLAEDKSALSKLYNTLNGHTLEIDFKIGDVIVPDGVYSYGFWDANEAGEKQSSRKQIEMATVIGINTLANAELTIEWQVPQRDGSFEKKTEKVYHGNCKKCAVI